MQNNIRKKSLDMHRTRPLFIEVDQFREGFQQRSAWPVDLRPGVAPFNEIVFRANRFQNSNAVNKQACKRVMNTFMKQQSSRYVCEVQCSHGSTSATQPKNERNLHQPRHMYVCIDVSAFIYKHMHLRDDNDVVHEFGSSKSNRSRRGRLFAFSSVEYCEE